MAEIATGRAINQAINHAIIAVTAALRFAWLEQV
jgi:hypothetical protein